MYRITDKFERLNSTQTEARVKLELVNHLAAFVRRGMPQAGFSSSNLQPDVIVNAIVATLARSLVNGMVDPVSDESLREQLIQAYLYKYEQVCRMQSVAASPAVLVTDWPQEAREMFAILKAMPVAAPYVEPTVAGALDMAWHNLYEAQQRWVVWLCLAAMYHQTPEGYSVRMGKGAVQPGPGALMLDDVSQCLIQQMRKQERHMMMFAIIQGGAALGKAQEWICQHSLSADMSIMEYLSLNNRIQGSWCTEEEESFRASLLVRREYSRQQYER